ncbi:MAG: virulence-associated E family protein [Phyllobacterium sp.]
MTPPPAKSRVANPLQVRQELNRHGLTKDLVCFDSFSHRIMLVRPIPRPGLKAPKSFEPREWQDTDDTALTEHLNSRGFVRISRGMVREVIDLEARAHAYHPIQDYLQGLQWDGVKRLSRFLVDYCGAAINGDTGDEKAAARQYVEAVTRCLFISAVARVFEPGCKNDHAVILEGGQGTLKSSLLRTLAVRDAWFSDSLPHNLGSRDARQHLMGVWIVELAEIAQFKKSEVEAVKDFLSCQTDRFRPPYGRSDIVAPRQCVLVGSTNSDVYFHDTTGNRRFWPVRITAIKLGDIRKIVNQLWAEAYDAWQGGEKWWLSSKIEKTAAMHQDDRLERDPWHDDIAMYVDSRVTGNQFTTADVLKLLDIPVARRERTHEMRVGAVLRLLGCTRRKQWNKESGKPRWVYQKGVPDIEEEAEEREENSGFKGGFNARRF